MVHELGHDLALPDLYDVDGSSAGMGSWSVMSYGSWGYAPGDTWQGQTPPLFDAWSRWYEGWIDPQTVTGTEARPLDAATRGSPDAAVVLGDNPAGHADWGSPSGGEYFLVENRQATPGTYDASLPGSGLLVLHVDESQWSNMVDQRRLVDVVEADGLDQLDTWGSSGDPGDLYRADGNAAFTDSSVPSSRLYDGSPSGAAMTGVGDSGHPMSATYTTPGPTTPRPANDDFAAATTIDGRAGAVDGDNLGAGAEPGEPNPVGAGNGTSVWWRWTAPADGPVTFDTFGPGIVDTVLGVYTGDDVAATTTVAEDDALDANQGYRQSRVTFTATAGTAYSILVDSHAGLPTGALRLNWSQKVVVPTNLAASLKVVDPPSGTTFAYRMTLTRSGGDDLAEVPVTLTLPPSVTPVGLPTGCAGTGTLTCLLEAVPTGTSRSVDVVVEPRSAGPHPATARLDAVDAQPADDVASATAAVADVCDNGPTAGNDVVTGTAGADVLCGLAGNDTFLGRGGDDLVFGGAGTDTLSYAASTGAMVVDLGAQALADATARQKGLAGDGADRATEVEQVVGTRYADTLTGSPTLADGLWGGAGNDVISGLGGADRLFGNAGADKLYGGDGNDRLVGGTGADRLDGGAQVDVCRERSDRRVACEG
jgi:Ca2+-binding RTX toxin-like protein